MTASNTDLKETRRAQIAAGALPLFLEKGFHATSIREIAEASGLSMGGLYEYITTKDDVLSLVYGQMTATVDEVLTAVPDAGQGELRSEIARILEAFTDKAPEVQVMYRETVSLDEEHREALAERERSHATRIAEHVRSAVERGELTCDDPLLVGHLITFLAAFMPLRGWLLRRDGLEPGPEIAEKVAALVVDALATR